LAAAIQPILPDAVAVVEGSFFARFPAPVIIYTYASRESFARYSAGSGYADGVTSLGAVHVSPKLLQTPERIRGIVTHELCHLHLLQSIGSLAATRIPSWFNEGLATEISHGGGAESVSADEALRSLAVGKRFVPEQSQWVLFPKSAASYGLQPHLYYREAALFVDFMRDRKPEAFQHLITALESKVDFHEAISTAYGESLTSLWVKFLAANHLRA